MPRTGKPQRNVCDHLQPTASPSTRSSVSTASSSLPANRAFAVCQPTTRDSNTGPVCGNGRIRQPRGSYLRAPVNVAVNRARFWDIAVAQKQRRDNRGRSQVRSPGALAAR